MNIKNMFKNLVAKIKAYFVKAPPAPTPVPVPNVTPPVPVPAPSPSVGPIVPPGPPPVYTAPDADGFVTLVGVDDQVTRHAIKEVADTLPVGTYQRASAMLNVVEANGEAGIGLSGGVCVQVEAYTNTVTGQPDFRIKQPTTSIPGTMAWPSRVNDEGYNLGKAAGVTNWLNHIAELQAANKGNKDFAHPK